MTIVGPKTLTEQAYTLATQHQQLMKAPLLYWLVSDSRTVHVAQSMVQTFLPTDANISVFAIDLGDERSTMQLEALLVKQSGICIISIDDFSKLGLALSLQSAGRVAIRVGQSLNPLQLKKNLVKTGYSEHEALFSVAAKGGTVLIQIPDTTYRVFFNELGIERVLDETTGSNRSTLVLPPAELNTTEVPEKEIPILRGDVLIDQALEMRMRKTLPSNQVSWVQSRFLPFDSSELSGVQRFDFALVEPIHKSFDRLAKQLNDWNKTGFRVAMFVLDPDVLRTALKSENIDANTLDIRLQSVPMQGFVDTAGKQVVLTHADIFGRRTVKKEAKRDEAAFLTSLHENDYVVHEDHGVGRYLGLVTSSIEGHTRENLLIEYAKGDRLYVPVELAYKVDRYVGEAKPALQRLSGTSWVRLTRKAAYDSQAFAKELLGMYAKRSLVTIDPWHIYLDADRDMHAHFGYQETPDQEKAIQEVYTALGQHEPMDFLVVGDVGFGKTEVAMRAAYQAFLNKKQVVVLCPTTLLAQQHYDTFKERFARFGVRVEMLSRFTGLIDKRKRAADIIKDMEAGEVHIVIGTHRLLSQDIRFEDLGLIIIDEEQRFGVRHKERLKGLRSQAHVLTLSATPIPRTLYFSLSGLRDIATIQTPPQGRQAIETSIEPLRHERIKEVIDREIARGGQVFYLYNHVQTIHTAKRRLHEMLGDQITIDIVHGQMPEEEMARVAEAFDHGTIDVLVCTTIIESGLDLPNVNTLIVENATRFGLGQLYQIRGRIGRGVAKAFAYFMYPTEGLTGVAARRLQILQEAKELGSGFQLAMRDLEMRGMGQLIGKRQHGHIQQVGLNLYGRLLRQAVEEIESGEVAPPRRSVSLSVPLDYGIPESLVPSAETRSRLYRQLSQADDTETVASYLQPYAQAIAQLPANDQQKITNLQRVLELRTLAIQAGVVGLDYQETTAMDGRKHQDVSIEMHELRPEHVERLIPLFADFKVSGNSIIIKADYIRDFYTDMKKALQALK